MTNLLQQHFPMIRSRDAILNEIHSNPYLAGQFDNWKASWQAEFLNLCSVAKGVKVLYDGFSKEILNPETHPDRLNELLSLILGKKATILHILPNDNSRIADETSLLLMDIVVKLEDGSIVNVEVQKVGYHFPGERCACYSSDLLLRQYKTLHAQKENEPFSYRDMKNVYTIVFFEKSTKDFHEFPDIWKHHFEQKSDSGLKLNLLQEYFFIPLDIFLKSKHNNPIESRFDAWLTFLGSDAPEDIISVISQFPDFKALYEHIYEICLNVERVMEMFSKELLEMDRNTVHYMIDEMQANMNRMQDTLDKTQEKLDITQEKLDTTQEKLDTTQEKLNTTQENLDKAQAENMDLKTKNTDLKTALEEAKKLIAMLQNKTVQ